MIPLYCMGVRSAGRRVKGLCACMTVSVWAYLLG